MRFAITAKPGALLGLAVVVLLVGTTCNGFARSWRQNRDYAAAYEGTVVRKGVEYPIFGRLRGNLDVQGPGYAYVVIRTANGREEQRYLRLDDQIRLKPGDHVIKASGTYQRVTSPRADTLNRVIDSLRKAGRIH